MPSAERGKWCEEHQRGECVCLCSDGVTPCHSPRMVTGSDKCRMHLGRKAKVVIAEAKATAAAEKAVRTYGLRRDISATDALIEEVQWTAGHVAWLREQVQALEAGMLTWGVTEEAEKQATEFQGTDVTRAAVVNVWVKLYQDERKHLVDVCKAAITAGIEERRVRLAESQGQIVASVIRAILSRLGLSQEQQQLVPVVVPEELRRAAVAALN